MNQSYELVFEGVKDPNPQTLQRVKAVLIGDLNLTIDQVKGLLNGEQTLILESQDSMVLNVPYELLKKSGAKVAIVEKVASEIGTVDVSLSTLALDDNYSEPLFPKVVQPERLIASESDDGFGDLTIDISIQHPEPAPALPVKPESKSFELTMRPVEATSFGSMGDAIDIPQKASLPDTKQQHVPTTKAIIEAKVEKTFSFSLEEAPVVIAPLEKIATKEEKFPSINVTPTLNNLELSLEEPVSTVHAAPTSVSPPSEKPKAIQIIPVEKSSSSELSLSEPVKLNPVVAAEHEAPSPLSPPVSTPHTIAKEPEFPPLASIASVVPLATPQSSVTSSLKEEAPSQVNKEKKKTLGALPLLLLGVTLLVGGNVAYKSITDNTAQTEAIIGQSLLSAMKPIATSAKVDKKSKKDSLSSPGPIFVPPTQFKQSEISPTNASFATALSYSEEHLSGTVEFNDPTPYVPDIERIRARLAPLPIISKIFIEIPPVVSDARHSVFRWTGPAAISVTVGELKTRRVGSTEFSGTIVDDKFVGVISVALNLDVVTGEPVDPYMTAEGQVTFRITKSIEASKEIIESSVKESPAGTDAPVDDAKS